MTPDNLINFTREIEQVRSFIEYIKQTNKIADTNFSDLDIETEEEQIYIDILMSNFQEYHRYLHRSKKLFDYKSIIISLYGILENNIEIWIKDFLDTLSTLAPYNDLDIKIKSEHFSSSMKLISIIIENRWEKYRHLNKESILKNLFKCIENHNDYKINTDAFIIQSGNLKHSKIVDLFKKMGIDINKALLKNQDLRNSFFEYDFPVDSKIIDRKINNTNKNSLYFKIDDLVDRRNLIAHGSESINDILNFDVLETYIDFLETYCIAIFNSLEQIYFENLAKYKFTKIQKIHNVWGNSILGFEIENYTLTIGDNIIIKTSNGIFHKVKIFEIKKNRNSYMTIVVRKKSDITIKVEIRINTQCSFYLPNKK